MVPREREMDSGLEQVKLHVFSGGGREIEE